MLRWFWLMLLSLQAYAFEPDKVNYRFDNIGAEQGLANLEVKTVLQDTQGFIWVGTLDGLYRYDGYDFKAFRHDADDEHSLPGNVIESLHEDTHGRLWVGTEFAGLALYHGATERFTRFNHDSNNPNSLNGNSVFSIFEDKQSQLWFGTDAGLNIIDAKTGNFIHYTMDANRPAKLSKTKVVAIAQDSAGYIWAGTSNDGLNRLDKSTGQFRHYQHMPFDPDSLSHNKIHSLFRDSDSQLWIGTQGGGLNRYDSEKDSFVQYRHNSLDPDSLSSDHVYAVFEDNQGALWVGTRFGGLNQFERSNQRFIRYQNNPRDKYSLIDNDVFSIVQDDNGLIWLGLFGGGLSKFDPASKRFGMLKHEPEVPGSLTEGYIRALYKDPDGTLWVGTENGLNRYNNETGQFMHFQHDADWPGSLSDNNVLSITQDNRGILWVGTLNGGLNRYNRQDSTFSHYKHDPENINSLSDNTVKALKVDSHGDLWVATNNGLNRFNHQNSDFTRFLQPADKTGVVGTNNINTLLISDETIWIGTNGAGIARFNTRDKSFKRYLHDPMNSKSLSNNTVFSIYQDLDNNLWFGTLYGLNRLSEANQTFTRFNRKNGLVKNRVNAVMGDSEGYLWLGEGGISRLNPQTGKIQNHIGHEAQCSQTNLGAYFLGADGQLFFASEGHLCAFFPQSALNKSKPPKIALLDFKLQNKSVAISHDNSTVLGQAINYTNNITLNHQDTLLSFEFAALHYSDQKKNQYQYMLQGFDRQWLQTDYANRRATYSNLSPGTYTFKVKASNHEGVFAPNARSISIKIAPPPWASWWAFTLYTLSIVSVLGAFAYQRNLRQKALVLAKENAEKAQQNADLARINAEKSNQAKSSFIANVSHEIRTPLNAVLGHTQILARDSNLNEKQRHSLEVIARSSDHLLELINNILDISKIEAQEMRLHEASFELVDLVKGIGIMFQNRAREKHLGWEFINDCDDYIPVVGDQGKLRQVLINLLGNALKFTKEGGIVLQLAPAGQDSYQFTVADSGVGISPEHQKEIFKAFGQTLEGSQHGGTGLGLAISNRQVSLMGGSLQVDSKLGFGSRFFFTLQLTPSEQIIEGRHNKQVQSVKRHCGTAINMLVVDDIKENRDILCRILQDVGITVELAENGQQALDKLQGGKQLPDLIFMDVRMPIMDGVTAVKAIRKKYQEKSPICVVVTAHAMRQDVEEYLALGFDHYIAKPFRFEAIYEAIHQLLDVDFDYEEFNQKPAESIDLAEQELPSLIYQALLEGAQDYEITKLEEALEQLNEHSKHGARLAEHLSQYLINYDMDGLINELEQISVVSS